MKKWMTYIFVFCLVCSFQQPKTPVVKWVVTNGCSLKVSGSTNINNFNCDINSYGRTDTIFVSKSVTAPLPLSGIIYLNVQSFDCHNGIMTADLRKTLKSKEFPHLIIKFISINKYPEKAQEVTKGVVSIQLAGVTKQYEVNYRAAAASKSHIFLVGSQQVTFSDFNLTPPRKLGGMIKTNNELAVTFNLNLQVI
jgi:hypothetical protein